ncbi:MAG: group II truncated hemoglobin [Myxococcota bacterium]|nr:group II truncated hemoglobin [Myxococcota bacterium]
MSDEKYISIFELLGGTSGVRKLVDRFYDLMSVKPEAQDILKMHPTNLQSSREKLYLFLVGWFGGPQLYVQKYGHPRLRMRHLPFSIDSAARDAWMICMREALEEQIPQEEIRVQIEGAFARLADHMRNTPDG